MIKETLPDKSGNPENLKKQLHQFKWFSTNVHIVTKDLLRASYRLFHLQFCDSSYQRKTLCSKGFNSNLRDAFT